MTWRRTLADLALGVRCHGCDAPGVSLCPACWSELPYRAWRRRTAGASDHPLPIYAATTYQDPISRLIVAHKDRGARGLTSPLAQVLAVSVLAAIDADPGRSEDAVLWLVPIPSSRATLRERGEDPMRRLARLGAAHLRSRGLPVALAGGNAGLLAAPHGPDQGDLTRAQRERNRSEPWRLRVGACGWLARHEGEPLILLDDVVTTGSTLLAARAGLESVPGRVWVRGAAVIAEVAGPPQGPSAQILSPKSLPVRGSGV